MTLVNQFTNIEEYSEIVSYSKNLSENYLQGKQPQIKGGGKALDNTIQKILLYTRDPSKVRLVMDLIIRRVKETYCV